jgi:hypothetical protein
MRFEIIICFGPPRSAGVMKKPRATMKTRSPPAATPGRESGSVTRQKVRKAPAPRLAEACRSSGGIASSELSTGKIT